VNATAKISCPGCGHAGRKVGTVTTDSVLVDAARKRAAGRALLFCRTNDCDVIYFDEQREETFGAGELRVTVFQKSASPERLVCYCFDHSVRSIHDEVRETGTSAVPESIGKKCKEGLDACETNNPQGSCCLGNVRQVVKAAALAEGGEVPVEEAAPASCCAGASSDAQAKHCESPPRTEAVHDCCESETESAKPPPAQSADTTTNKSTPGPSPSAGLLASGGAVVGALLASACCWLPLALIGLGASTVGVAGFFEAYRPHFLGLTGLLLAGGFYYVYLRKPQCAPGEACAVPNPRLERINKISLWVATLMVVVFATFPNYVGMLYGDGGPEAAIAVAQAPTDVERTYAIEGMTCEGCAGHLRTVIGELPGVTSAQVSYVDRTATVVFADGHYDDDAVSRAVAEIGYSVGPPATE